MLDTKIIYSLKVATKLIALGHQPVGTMANPMKPEFTCWIFEVTPEFQGDLDKVLGGVSHG